MSAHYQEQVCSSFKIQLLVVLFSPHLESDVGVMHFKVDKGILLKTLRALVFEEAGERKLTCQA